MTQSHLCETLICTWRSLWGTPRHCATSCWGSSHGRHLQSITELFTQVKFQSVWKSRSFSKPCFRQQFSSPWNLGCWIELILPSLLTISTHDKVPTMSAKYFKFSYWESLTSSIWAGSISHPNYFHHLLTNHTASFCTKRMIWTTSMVSKACRIWTLPTVRYPVSTFITPEM